MKQVFVAQHPAEAHFVKGLLAASGIQAVVLRESLFGARGEAPTTPDTLPSVWVCDDAEASKAAGIVADYGRGPVPCGDGSAGWRCPACDERLEPQFTECWRCGASRPAE
jgi:hypothetical protein